MPGKSADHFDLAVIGTGAAGMAAAIEGAGMGARVAIVERGVLGGTCVNVGCIPSKNLIAAAEHLHRARTGFPGIPAVEPEVDWRTVLGQKRKVVEDLRRTKYVDVLESYPGITLLRGSARLEARQRITVGERTYGGAAVVLATGTEPWIPPIPGLDAVGVLDSTTAMELDELPRSLAVLGAGSVGLELGQVFARFGVRVTVLERVPRILPLEDPELTALLLERLEGEGIEIRTGVEISCVTVEDGIRVLRASDGSEVRAHAVLVAAGRRARSGGLGLERVGVEVDDRGFVQVDDLLRTSAPGVFAAGDLVGLPGFVYVAAASGRLAARNALRSDPTPLDLGAVPRVTFTSPQIAAVGVNEAEADARGIEVEVSRLDWHHLPRAVVEHRTDGLVKLILERGTRRLIGFHALGEKAGELLGEATLAVRLGARAEDLAETLHPYLTWTEAIKLGAQALDADVSKLSCCA